MVNAAAQYRRALKKKLRCSKDVKKRLLEGFDKTVDTFLEENTAPSMDDLISAFGPAEEMADVLMKEVTPQELVQYHKNMLFTRFLAGILSAVLVLTTIYVLFIKEFRITATHEIYETTNDWDAEYIPIEEDPTP